MIPSFAIPKIKRGLARNQMRFRLKRLRAISRALSVQDIRKELQFPGFDPYTVKFYMNIDDGIAYSAITPSNRYPDGRILIEEPSKDAQIRLLSNMPPRHKRSKKDTLEKGSVFERHMEKGKISGMLQREANDWAAKIAGPEFYYSDYATFEMTNLVDFFDWNVERHRLWGPFEIKANQITIFHLKPIDSWVTFDSVKIESSGSFREYYFHKDLLQVTT